MKLANILPCQKQHEVQSNDLVLIATGRLAEFLIGIEGLQLSVVTSESFIIVKMYADDGAGFEDLAGGSENLWGYLRGRDQRVVLEEGKLQR